MSTMSTEKRDKLHSWIENYYRETVDMCGGYMPEIENIRGLFIVAPDTECEPDVMVFDEETLDVAYDDAVELVNRGTLEDMNQAFGETVLGDLDLTRQQRKETR